MITFRFVLPPSGAIIRAELGDVECGDTAHLNETCLSGPAGRGGGGLESSSFCSPTVSYQSWQPAPSWLNPPVAGCWCIKWCALRWPLSAGEVIRLWGQTVVAASSLFRLHRQPDFSKLTTPFFITQHTDSCIRYYFRNLIMVCVCVCRLSDYMLYWLHLLSPAFILRCVFCFI